MKILKTSKVNNWGDYSINDTNAFLIRDGKTVIGKEYQMMIDIIKLRFEEK